MSFLSKKKKKAKHLKTLEMKRTSRKLDRINQLPTHRFNDKDNELVTLAKYELQNKLDVGFTEKNI